MISLDSLRGDVRKMNYAHAPRSLVQCPIPIPHGSSKDIDLEHLILCPGGRLYSVVRPPLSAGQLVGLLMTNATIRCRTAASYTQVSVGEIADLSERVDRGLDMS